MKRQRYKMKSRLSGVIAMTLFLAGCGSAGALDKGQGDEGAYHHGIAVGEVQHSQALMKYAAGAPSTIR